VFWGIFSINAADNGNGASREMKYLGWEADNELLIGDCKPAGLYWINIGLDTPFIERLDANGAPTLRISRYEAMLAARQVKILLLAVGLPIGKYWSEVAGLDAGALRLGAFAWDPASLELKVNMLNFPGQDEALGGKGGSPLQFIINMRSGSVELRGKPPAALDANLVSIITALLRNVVAYASETIDAYQEKVSSPGKEAKQKNVALASPRGHFYIFLSSKDSLCFFLILWGKMRKASPKTCKDSHCKLRDCLFLGCWKLIGFMVKLRWVNDSCSFRNGIGFYG